MNIRNKYEIGDIVFIIKQYTENKKTYYRAEKDLVIAILASSDKIQYELKYNTEFLLEDEVFENATQCVDKIVELILPTINN